jgi:hypothetical protein
MSSTQGSAYKRWSVETKQKQQIKTKICALGVGAHQLKIVLRSRGDFAFGLKLFKL